MKTSIDKFVTPVIFRYDDKHEECIAIFPYLSSKRNLKCSAFVLGEGHQDLDYDILIRTTRPALPDEYINTKYILRDKYGYNLKIIQRACHRKMYKL